LNATAQAQRQHVSEAQVDLAREIASCYYDPLGFVMLAYPWGKPGTMLENHKGPDQWQRDELLWLGEQVRARAFDGIHPVKPIRAGYSSGHGVGKSTYAAWITDWIMSTRPHSMGTITANTFPQLERKTWATIRAWTKLCITAHWFRITADIIFHRSYPDTWQVGAQSCKEENSEAFAGQHAARSTSFYIFDESSAVPDKIFEVSEGGLTDGEPMIIMLGNCTRSSGKFFRVNFGSERDSWHHRTIDSRSSAFSNKELLNDWIEAYGLDSDFCRVRILGLPPKASDTQFIDYGRILAAQQRKVIAMADEPLVVGVDFAWGGEDDNVARFRRGPDARSIPPVRIPGEFTRDPAVMTTRLADILSREYDVGAGKKQKVAMMFLDSAGIAGPVGARLRALGHTNVMDIDFGADSPDPKYVYFRDVMWGRLKDWLLGGAIDNKHDGTDRCPHCQLEIDLAGPSTVPDRHQRVKLESKEKMKARDIDSPDDADALALTFAYKVLPPAAKPVSKQQGSKRVWG
jgi:hypothetical protein